MFIAGYIFNIIYDKLGFLLIKNPEGRQFSIDREERLKYGKNPTRRHRSKMEKLLKLLLNLPKIFHLCFTNSLNHY